MTEAYARPSGPTAAERLAAARTKLILDHPFLGALVLRLPLRSAGAWCRTTATDARALYYNPRWIDSLASAQLQFALAHEALHCGLGHFARRGSREKQRWDLACDFAINPLLLDEGLKPPPEAQVLAMYRNMSAEEIYPCIEDQLEDSETLDEHAWDGDEGGQGGDDKGADGVPGGGAGSRDQEQEAGGGSNGDSAEAGDGDSDADVEPEPDAPRPPPLRAAEREQLRQQWQRHLATAAQRARQAGKLPGALSRLVDASLAPQVSWRAALAHYLAQTSRDDYTWLRPSRREGDVVWPSLRNRSGDIVVALDTSGSIGDEDIARFLAEINALKGTLPVRTTLLACDSALAADGPWITEAWEALTLPRRFAGGGGSDFAPVFDWVERAGLHPDALVYFTDAEGHFPDRPPDYPVLWLVKGRAPVPWGRRIGLN